MFIAVEGMDGSGKSTQIGMLKEHLQKLNREVLVTREPGGTRLGEMIRTMLLDASNQEMSSRTEALLYAASRAQHLEEVIHPATKEGKTVISDRYVISSYVYQGIARGLGLEAVKQINDFATGGRMPDLTIFLFVEEETAIQRKKGQKELDRLEAEAISFHEKVNKGFREVAESYAYPKIIVEANCSAQEVHTAIWEQMERMGLF